MKWEKWNDQSPPFCVHHCAKPYDVAWFLGEVLAVYPSCWAWSSPFLLFQPVAVCRSTVRMSAEQVQNVWVRCHWSSSSGSSSSEEVCTGACTGVHRYAPHPSTGDRAAGPSGAWASVWTCRLTFIVPYFFQSHLSKILNTSLRKQWAKVLDLSVQFTASLV